MTWVFRRSDDVPGWLPGLRSAATRFGVTDAHREALVNAFVTDLLLGRSHIWEASKDGIVQAGFLMEPWVDTVTLTVFMRRTLVRKIVGPILDPLLAAMWDAYPDAAVILISAHTQSVIDQMSEIGHRPKGGHFIFRRP